MNHERMSLLLLLPYLIVPALLIYLLSISPSGSVPLSPEAFIAPFMGMQGKGWLALSLLAAFDLIWYHASLLPSLRGKAGAAPLAVAVPQLTMVLGFIIGYMESDVWVSIPFFLAAAGSSAYGWMRTSRP